MHPVRFPLLSLLASTLLLAGCASFKEVPRNAETLTQVSLTLPGGLPAAVDSWPADDWWRAYNDPQLERLITHALQNSPSLALAQSRIAQAQAAAGLAQSNGAPQVNAGLDLSYGRYSENYQVPKPPIGKGGVYVGQGRGLLDFSYDLDLWGKNAAVINAAQAQYQAAQFDRAAARLALTTTIVRSYLQLASQYEVQEILQASLKQRMAISELSRQRVARGLDSRVEQLLADSNQAALGVDLVQLETSLAVLRLQLAALSGDMPASAAGITRPLLTQTAPAIPASLPLDLLGRRPELAAQRRRIDAALGEAAAAKALFYPNINLLGYLGTQAFGLNQLLAAGSLTNSVGPALRLPLFEGGRLRANYAMKAAEIDSSIHQYNQSVINAAQEVSEQLTRLAALASEQAANDAALRAAAEAYRLALLRYQGGLSPYLTVLNVETQLLAQRRIGAEQRARRQDLQIMLVRSLGGGFSETAPTLARNHKNND